MVYKWQLVPIEPTTEMLHAATMQTPTWDDDASRRKYAAMLKAAPQPDRNMSNFSIGDQTKAAEQLVYLLIEEIGDDPGRGGLRDTPRRVIRAWKEWAIGYRMDPAEILKTFDDGAEGMDEMVIVHNIPFISKCEHHLADMIGIAHVGYIPNGRIVGLSKLARLVDCFARRLQVQERATVQIADAMVEYLNPVGVGVMVRAAHGCMSTRGVKIHKSFTTTSAMRGVMLSKSGARKEFLKLCAMAEKER
jgi:GTP cyclohydrolase IA